MTDVDVLDELQAGTEEPRDAEADAAKLAAMNAQAKAAIEHDKQDARQQRYMRNATTGKLIRTNADYHRAVENRHGYVSITYNQALDLYRKEEGDKKRALGKALAKKRAKASRKRNRNG